MWVRLEEKACEILIYPTAVEVEQGWERANGNMQVGVGIISCVYYEIFFLSA